MAECSPQRYLANDRNLTRSAALTPSSVLPVADSILELPVARVGTGQVLLTGDYSGAEEIALDIQVADQAIDVANISAPVFTGAGSGQDPDGAYGLLDIVATGTPQTYTVQLHDAGLPFLNAGIDFEGVRIIARAPGTAGNGIEIEVDQTTLTFTPQDFSLLEDLAKGDGAESTGLKGAALDWDTKVIGVDDVIPAAAHRVAFGNDKGDVYLQYKKYVDGEWVYHFVPEIKRAIPKGSRVSFVTGGRLVTVTDPAGPTVENFPGIVTVWDLLDTLFRTSALVSVLGVIANDRTPEGMASKELALRTDAHVEPSTGSGSSAATGFVDTFANENAATELVVAHCYAVTSQDHPLARLGSERWTLKGSVSGELGDIVTGVPFVEASNKFGLTVPERLPPGFDPTTPRGRFTVTEIRYITRDKANEPPICPVALTLGTEAVDQTITLVWTERPSGACLCDDMEIPALDPRCLGIGTEGEGMTTYSSDAIARLKALYDWADTLATAVTTYNNGMAHQKYPDLAVGYASGANLSGSVTLPGGDIQSTISGGQIDSFGSDFLATTEATVSAGYASIWLPDDFQACIDIYENGIAQIDAVIDTTLRSDGFDKWDDALAVFQSDLSTSVLATFSDRLASIATGKYKILVAKAMAYAGIPQLGKSSASVLDSGDGCWHDLGGNFWTVTGSARGAYAPAFNNAPYYSSVLSSDGKAYYSTREFGFQINIKCPQLLEFGDEIVLTIGDAGVGSTYQVGDELTLPIIAAQPQVLAGGQDGNSDLVWYVSGTVDGTLANFTYSPSSSPPGDYSDAGLSFTYVPGGIPNEVGDKFTFTVEGGHWQYRIDSGPWILNSPSDDIDSSVQPFIDGLSVQFVTGAAPSFVTGDVYSFRVAQPWAVSNLQTPNRYRWRWDEAAPTLVFDMGADQAVKFLAIARHTLPAGASILVEGGTAPGVYTWSQPLTWTADAIVAEFPEQTARYLRLTLGAADGGGIGWFYASGDPLATTLSAAVQLRRVYNLEGDGTGLDQGSTFMGRARSGTIEWSEAALSETDVDGLGSMLDWLKEHDDEAFVFVPNITRPAEAYAGLVAIDDVEFAELSDYNRDATFERRYSISLPFAGAWR